MKEILTIQEFSELTGIGASTLRYWDRIGVFTPLIRDEKTGYRHYSSAQILALNFVTALSMLHIPLEKIAELRNERSPEQLLELLQSVEHDMDMEMRNLRQRYSMIHARRELISMGMKADEGRIGIEQLDEKDMMLSPRNEYNDGDTFLEPLSKLIGVADELHIDLNFPVGGMHDNMSSFVSAPGCPDFFICLDPVGLHRRNAGDYLVGYARGYYGDVGDLPERMLNYAERNALSLTGPVYTVYLFEEISTGDTSQYLASCSVAVK